MPSAYHVPTWNKCIRHVIRSIFRGLYHLLFTVRITGIENVPKKGAYIVAINHVSIFDPPFAISFWPVSPEVIGAAEVFQRPGQNLLALLYHVIPVHRGEYDPDLLKQVFYSLNSGLPLLMAPEGTRSHVPPMQKAKPGIAYIASKVKVPIIPVGIEGTTEDLFQSGIHGLKPQVSMIIGQPFFLPEINSRGAEKRKQLQRNADMVMTAIAALLPSEYRGVYADQTPTTG